VTSEKCAKVPSPLPDIRAGLPAVYGEDVGDDTGGYHFYPDRERVREWLTEAGFKIVEEADERLEGYGYHHLLVRTIDDP